MDRVFHHVFWPLLFSVGIIVLAALPADLVAAMGCRNRGLMAVFIAGSSGMLGVATAFKAVAYRLRGRRGSEYWVLSALLFVLPLVFLLILA